MTTPIYFCRIWMKMHWKKSHLSIATLLQVLFLKVLYHLYARTIIFTLRRMCLSIFVSPIVELHIYICRHWWSKILGRAILGVTEQNSGGGLGLLQWDQCHHESRPVCRCYESHVSQHAYCTCPYLTISMEFGVFGGLMISAFSLH